MGGGGLQQRRNEERSAEANNRDGSRFNEERRPKRDDRNDRRTREEGKFGPGQHQKARQVDRNNRLEGEERGYTNRAHLSDRRGRFANDEQKMGVRGSYDDEGGSGYARDVRGGRNNRDDSRRDVGQEEERRKQFAAQLGRDEHDNNGLNERRRVAQLPKRTYFPPEHIDAYVSCHPGLETFLCQELDALNIAHKVKGFGVTLSSPSLYDLLNCHLYLGTASNVFLRCGEPFSARALGELERKVEIMPWRKMLAVADDAVPRFHFKVTSAKSRLLHSTAIRDHVLVGIYKSLGFPDFEEQKNKNNAKSDAAPESDDQIRLTVQFFRDKAQISIDTSQTPIHQRGYRLETAKAPLREDLAFAFLYSAGWKPAYSLHAQTVRTPTFTSFLDPFCGSGTLPIEAAAMTAGLPPGRLRVAPMKGTCLYDPPKWKRLVTNALQKSTTIDASGILIRASDRDQGAVRATKANADRAGVLNIIGVQDCAFTAHPWLDKPSSPAAKLLLAANLPFGRRVRAASKPKNYLKHPLLPLYQSLANKMNSLSDAGCQFGAVLLTDDRELLRLGGFREQFETRMSTKHGGIPVSGMFMDGILADGVTAATVATEDETIATLPHDGKYAYVSEGDIVATTPDDCVTDVTVDLVNADSEDKIVSALSPDQNDPEQHDICNS